MPPQNEHITHHQKKNILIRSCFTFWFPKCDEKNRVISLHLALENQTMLRSIKRRVKSFGSTDSGSKKNERNTNLDTPRREVVVVEVPAPSSEPRPAMRRHRSNSIEHDVTVKIPFLSSFDKCIETSDAMIASSSAQQTESILSDRKDTSTGLPDCSLLVSPDGEFLLVPTGENKNLFRKDLQLSSFSELMLHGKDDYQSSVFIGDDLYGDKRLNRFSAKGWSIPATTVALEQAGASLQSMAHFCEQIVLSNKEGAARTSIACDNLRTQDFSAQATASKGSPSHQASSWEIIDPRATDFDVTPERLEGPFGSGTLARATEAVSGYYAGVAEMESGRWRAASLQGVLPTIHAACDQFAQRSKNRSDALKASTQRAQKMEEKLRKLQQVAEKKWQAVYKAEERVTKRMEDLMTERSKEKQKARLKQLQEGGQKEFGGSPNSNASNNLSEEVWNMVSSVAESLDNGSYEPMCNSIPSDIASTVSDDAASLPMVDREDIETELGLPALRAAALKAEEDVTEAGDTLLNVLSSLDTTRRSAKVAAETCLAGAGNAHETCLRSMIALERKSLQERLRALDGIDEILEAIDIRSDIDLYISRDKKVRGGTSHLADDDDGGIASALATLSSHVEGTYERPASEYNWDESERGEKMSTSKINLAVDKLFQHNDSLKASANATDSTVIQARADFDENTEFLCNATQGETSSSRTRRSAICYALNSKRGSNSNVGSTIQFNALCRLFSDILTGCQEEGVSNAKMCMMLAQTFYMEREDMSLESSESKQQPSPRTIRIYVKTKLTGHPIWSRDEFWYVLAKIAAFVAATHWRTNIAQTSISCSC